MKTKKGVILNNIGTPNAPDIQSVKKYLHEFLTDKHIITAPTPIRFALVYGLIVPQRARYSTENYKKIWTPEGSPLMSNTIKFAAKLQNTLGNDYFVEIGMRYGKPNIEQALVNLKNKGITNIVFAPLYPQFCMATTGSAVEKLNSLNNKYKCNIKTLQPFYHKKEFIDSYVEIILGRFQEISNLENFEIIFSYHGLPDKKINQEYYKQCLETSELIKERILKSSYNLKSQQFHTSFQSRLGPIQWLKPYTRDVVLEFAKAHKKNVIVVCPSFVTDCIETLEEIAIGLKEEFFASGGESFACINCPNDEDHWVKNFSQMLIDL